jgi:hypothetical protein
MYGLIALIQFGWYCAAFGMTTPVSSPELWFTMQLSILAGFATSFPVEMQ